jgi:hypothetical protein
MTVMLPRVFYAIVGAFSLWVGVWSYFEPSLVVNAIPWPAPPLHARFIGALNLSAFVICAGAAFSRSPAATRHVPLLIAVWAGVICGASFLHLSATQFDEVPVRIWIFAYVAFPLAAIFLGLAAGRGVAGQPVQPLPVWQKIYLCLQGGILLGLGAVLFLAPALAAALWPWALNETLAQLYAGPLLAYGIVSLMALRVGYGPAKLPMAGALVFAVLVLVASLLHRALFSPQAVSSWVWFMGFAVAALSLAVFLLPAVKWRRIS